MSKENLNSNSNEVKLLLLLSKLRHLNRCNWTHRVLVTVHAAKCYDQSRLITWNFESHVTFLRGYIEEIS